MDFIPVLVERFEQDADAKAVWERIYALLGNVDGIAFYAHPTLVAPGQAVPPDFVVLARGYEPFVVRCIHNGLDDVDDADSEHWTVNGQEQDAPAIVLDDLVTALRHRFESVRPLRHKMQACGVIALPHIAKADFVERFGDVIGADHVLWQAVEDEDILPRASVALSDQEWTFAKSVFQSAHVISRAPPTVHTNEIATTLGAAIRLLERRIALLDTQQLRGALQVAPGPQRIRGLAGTGKTVLLAMKAATLHSHYPEKRILFTFHTQSLYNQTRSLITRFFRTDAGVDPDWNMIHIRHAWGGRGRPGVYSELSLRQGVSPMVLPTARQLDRESPLRACCVQALKGPIVPQYDYVMVDEGQDLPTEFFQILYKLSRTPHPIYFSYDEMQNLSNIDIPSPAELFGKDASGNPNVSLDGEYPSGLEKDLILFKSYRCPQEVLMVAHAVGLGLYAPSGCVQMLSDEGSWNAVGYMVEKGPLRKGEKVIIGRPTENSPNPMGQIYNGPRRPVERFVFNTRSEELDWVVREIAKDVNEEAVRPEDIVVTYFEAREAKQPLQYIQAELFKQNIASTIPGLVGDAAEFAEAGHVTLATAYRAKGNEAPVVYLLGCDLVQSYAYGREARNRAFTCISRSKGWVRISGTGQRMADFAAEIDRILADIPSFKFTFPDPATIPKLDAETTKRREQVKALTKSVKELLHVDDTALADLDEATLSQALQKLKSAQAKK